MRGCIVQARLAQVKPLPPSLNVSMRVSEPKRVYDLSTFIQVRPDVQCKRYRDTQVYEHVALSSSPGGVTPVYTLQTQSGPLTLRCLWERIGERAPRSARRDARTARPADPRGATSKKSILQRSYASPCPGDVRASGGSVLRSR